MTKTELTELFKRIRPDGESFIWLDSYETFICKRADLKNEIKLQMQSDFNNDFKEWAKAYNLGFDDAKRITLDYLNLIESEKDLDEVKVLLVQLREYLD